MGFPHFRRAVIHGVGLLGGSLGMALRRRGLADEIVGLGRSRKRLERAEQLGAIDRSCTDPAEALAGADAYIACLPPQLIRRKWAEIAPLAEPGIFVTDVGSVKAAIVGEGEAAWGDRAVFVGSHPMAGSEKSGAEAARGDLFEGASCFVTPTDRTSAQALSMAVRLWQAVGSRVVIIDPVRHDRLLARISHLPHLFAVALIELLYSRGDSTLFFRSVLGNGFRDSTRIAEGDPQVWEEIFGENAEAMVENLDEAIATLQQWRALLAARDNSAIAERLKAAGERRRELQPAAEPTRS